MHARTSVSAKLMRPAFTLVEMLVAMTLTIFLMVILSQAFIAGLETFSGLKAIGDMEEHLRAATTLIRYDLSQDHFEGKRRLSDLILLSGNANDKIRQGYFAMGQGLPGNPYKPYATYSNYTTDSEGSEDGIDSYRATDHWLSFSVKLRGHAREKLFRAVDNTPLPQPGWPKAPQPLSIPTTWPNGPPPPTGAGAPTRGAINYTFINPTINAVTASAYQNDAVFDEQNATVNANLTQQFKDLPDIYSSPWAEVAYVMVQTGTTQNPSIASGAGTPLFALYRCQYVVLPHTAIANDQFHGGMGNRVISYFPSFSVIPDPNNASNLKFLSPSDLAAGTRRFNPATVTNPPVGGSLVLSNVVSFQVRVLKVNAAGSAADFQDLDLPSGGAQTNQSFDTSNYGSANGRTFTLQALRITIRVWDPKSHQTRQITIVQDM